MAAPERLTATVSTKGQVVLPKAIRRALHLGAVAHCDEMLNCDRRFIERARGTPVRVVEP